MGEQDHSTVSSSGELATSWWRLLESTVALGFLTALAYYIGYSYYQGYFGLFGSGRTFEALSTGDYLTRAFESLTPFSIFLVNWAVPPWAMGKATHWRDRALVLFVAIVPVFILASRAYSDGFLDWVIGLGLLTIAIIVVGAALIGGNPVVLYVRGSRGRIPIYLYWSVSMVVIASNYMEGMGNADAKQYLSGNEGARRSLCST